MQVSRLRELPKLLPTLNLNNMDTAQVIANYLRNNPASACLVNTPLGYLSLILEMYERELEGLPVFCDANILQSIVQETKSDVVQDVVNPFILFTTG